MSKYVGLTEKRMADKRFRKTEEAILKVFFEDGYYMCAKEVAERAGVSRATVYNHHRVIREILQDYEKYILRKYRRMIRKVTKDKGTRLVRIYLRVLLFMVKEKKIFGMLIKNGRRTVLETMLFEIKTRIVNYAGLPKNSEKMFKIYVNEVTGLMVEWGRSGFMETEIENLLKDIMYLTDTLRSRLGRLIDN